jgi:phosphoribosylaminoimidazolecarboxamide formyltransferase / IMP cyclohydrolase
LIRIHRALLSVSFKKGIIQFAEALQKRGIEIISTGGTARTLREGGVPVINVSDVTGYPEILDGRVKTLHPAIHGAILARSAVESDMKTLEELNITPIELVVVNLYPFEETISNGKVGIETAVEQIDIGGPTMIRAAAKNFNDRAVIVNPDRYESIVAELDQNDGGLTRETRLALVREAFRHTAHYDSVIARYFESIGTRPAVIPDVLSVSLQKESELRYGENPHQQAALYGKFFRYFESLHGKQLSYNNILDVNAAAQTVNEFDKATVAIIKHNNPCGVASSETVLDAYEKAFACDRTSAFGGIVAVNRPLDMKAAQKINEIFTEVIVAPAFGDNVQDFLKQKKDRRVIRQLVDLRSVRDLDVRSVLGGLLVQERDTERVTKERFNVVTKRKPTEDETEGLLFAWRVAKFVKSNTIIFTRGERTLGIGAGQMSRIDSSRIAVSKAHDAGFDLAGSVAASDGFFPFADGLLELVSAGATAVIQPGGSIRDREVIEAADKHNIAMVFTGIRHFRH